MPKTIYTEQDIDALKARGATCVDVTDEVLLTDLAMERALKHGLKINHVGTTAPQATFSPSVNTYAAYAREAPPDADLRRKIKAAVLARINGQVDDGVLENTITRVMQRMG
ncbi:MAG: hypothetical protein Fur0022_24440 [Anaerolineales bacterium]